jgi:6-phosphogluconolactonase (cycloisomerase 2 family)
MLTSRKLSAAAAATVAASLTLAAGSAGAKPLFRGHDIHGPAGAVFVQSDATSGNTITVYARKHDGTLSQAGTYATGGQGAQLAGSVVDHLASQDSLVYDAGQRELFAVNAGSNTVSVFNVDGTKLRLRQVVDSGGTFPASIAVHGDLVYVLNGLNDGAIQGYRLTDGNLSPIAGSWRALGLVPDPTNPQFVSTPGDIAFSPDGGNLLVTTKATDNEILVFSVDASGLPAATPVVNSEPGDVPFSIAFEGGDQVAIGEAGPNAVASFDLLGDGTLAPLSTVGTGGAATCWLVADGSVLFAGNAGSATESSVLDSSSGALTLAATTSTDAGTVDATTSRDGRYLYVQTGGNGIVDEFWVGSAGSLAEIGSVTVPNAVGGEGIAAS